MLEERNNRNARPYRIRENERSNFVEHHKHMREFRRSHLDITLVNAPRTGEAVFLELMEPLLINHTVKEAGGSINPDGSHSITDLVPAWKVGQHRITCN